MAEQPQGPSLVTRLHEALSALEARFDGASDHLFEIELAAARLRSVLDSCSRLQVSEDATTKLDIFCTAAEELCDIFRHGQRLRPEAPAERAELEVELEDEQDG